MIVVFWLAANMALEFSDKNIVLFPELFPKDLQQKISSELGQPSVMEQLKPDPLYSPELDSDVDKLNNMKEYIYGTNIYISDTDGDEMSDGEEVFAGFDPLLPGTVALSQRAASNMTIEYFLWLAQKTKNPDPQFETEAVNEFVAQKLKVSLRLPEVDPHDITIAQQNNQAAIKAYLTALDSAPFSFPEKGYLEIAAEALAGNFSSLEKTLQALKQTSELYQTTPTPSQAIQIQKTYISLLDFARTMFLDVYRVKEDPVRILYNSKRGGELIKIIESLEQQKNILRK